MTTFEMCKSIRNAILNNTAAVAAYTDWTEKSAAGRIRGLAEKVKRAKWFKAPSIDLLTDAEMAELGFMRWTDNSPMRLIPLWLLPYLTGRLTVVNIDGTVARVEVDSLDNGNHDGMLPHGLIPADKH